MMAAAEGVIQIPTYDYHFLLPLLELDTTC